MDEPSTAERHVPGKDVVDAIQRHSRPFPVPKSGTFTASDDAFGDVFDEAFDDAAADVAVEAWFERSPRRHYLGGAYEDSPEGYVDDDPRAAFAGVVFFETTTPSRPLSYD